MDGMPSRLRSGIEQNFFVFSMAVDHIHIGITGQQCRHGLHHIPQRQRILMRRVKGRRHPCSLACHSIHKKVALCLPRRLQEQGQPHPAFAALFCGKTRFKRPLQGAFIHPLAIVFYNKL